MATPNIGFISGVGIFAEKLPRAAREAALRDFERIVDEGGRGLKDEVAEQFASLCDFGSR